LSLAGLGDMPSCIQGSQKGKTNEPGSFVQNIRAAILAQAAVAD